MNSLLPTPSELASHFRALVGGYRVGVMLYGTSPSKFDEGAAFEAGAGSRSLVERGALRQVANLSLNAVRARSAAAVSRHEPPAMKLIWALIRAVRIAG